MSHCTRATIMRILGDAGNPLCKPPESSVAVTGPVYLHGLMDAALMAAVREALHSTPPEQVHAGKFYAKRTFVRDRSLGERILAALPEELGFRGCVSDMRFYDYPLGGFIAPHLDEAHCCKETGRISTTTFLLYLLGVPEGEGGETVFLDRLPKDCLEGEDPRVLQSFVPVEGSILLFPHVMPHQGRAVGTHRKLLLRGDLY